MAWKPGPDHPWKADPKRPYKPRNKGFPDKTVWEDSDEGMGEVVAKAGLADEFLRKDTPPQQIDAKVSNRLHGNDYHPFPTVKAFLESRAFVRGIRGPVGGGKSTGCCEDIMAIARNQAKGPDGIRHSRFAIIRNTYGMLKDTTMKTWLDWFPEEWFGKFIRSQGEMRHVIMIGSIHTEILFRALDKPDDVRKVLSLELTGAWVNEAREVPKSIVDALGDRVGRYPAVRDGGCTRSGIIMDTNSPDEDHWWFRAAEEEKPEGWDFFAQPPGMLKVNGKWIENPAAENLPNLPPNYYATRAAGKREDYIRVYYGNMYGFVQEGKPVFPEYSDAMHAAKAELSFIPNLPVYIGIGIAPTCAALFGQKKANGQWVMVDEVMPESPGDAMFAEMVATKMAADYPTNTEFRVYCKLPKDSADADAETIRILRSRNVMAKNAPINDATLRREAVAGALSRLIHGEPSFLLSTRCKTLRKAFSGGYCFPRIQTHGEERFHDEPAKNRYSAMAEAAQFMLIGGGEGAHVFHQQKPKKLKYQELGIV